MDKLVLNLPLRIRNRVRTESYFYLNLNTYRNASFHELSDMKVKFSELIQNQLIPIKPYKWAEFEFILFPGSRREMDLSNICSVVDKFFCDAFVKAGKLEDDNYNFLRGIKYSFGEVDKNNPRVEVHIKGEPRKEEPMQLQALLDHSDFMEALDAYVRKQFPIPEGTVPQIDITAGRGDKGYSAVVSYASASDTQEAPKAATAQMAASLKAQGNSMNRLENDPMPKTMSKAETKPVEEPAPAAMSGAKIEDSKPKADELFQRGEIVQDEPEKEESKTRPLFNFGNK